jgi:anti-sigma B factor antagonist
MTMQFEERVVGDVAVVTVTGEITLKKSRSTMLHDKVRSLVEQGHRKVVVDVAGVSFVDSAGLGELVQTHSMIRNHGGALKLSGPTSRLRELLVLTRLTTLLGVYDDEEKALASFGDQRPPG